MRQLSSKTCQTTSCLHPCRHHLHLLSLLNGLIDVVGNRGGSEMAAPDDHTHLNKAWNNNRGSREHNILHILDGILRIPFPVQKQQQRSFLPYIYLSPVLSRSRYLLLSSRPPETHTPEISKTKTRRRPNTHSGDTTATSSRVTAAEGVRRPCVGQRRGRSHR